MGCEIPEQEETTILVEADIQLPGTLGVNSADTGIAVHRIERVRIYVLKKATPSLFVRVISKCQKILTLDLSLEIDGGPGPSPAPPTIELPLEASQLLVEKIIFSDRNNCFGVEFVCTNPAFQKANNNHFAQIRHIANCDFFGHSPDRDPNIDHTWLVGSNQFEL